MTRFAIIIFALAACTDERYSDVQQASCNGGDYYYDEYGDIVYCVYTGTDPDPWSDPCWYWPSLCEPPDPCDVNPSLCGGDDGGGGGGDPDPNASCQPPSPQQTIAYDRTRNKAMCVLQVPACALILSTAEQHNPRQVLSDLDVNTNIRGNCPADGPKFASTFGTGLGSNATIWLRQLFYTGLSNHGQVMVMLHELGHATGRIAANHQHYYAADPRNEDAWNTYILNNCVYSQAVRDRCGSYTQW